MMQGEQPLENKRSRMLSFLVGKSICCWKPAISMDAIRFSYLAGPLGGLHDRRGRLKSPPIIFMSASKAEILSKSRLRLSSKSVDEDGGL